jgi:DNA-binding MarR family transcriptional regulator
MNVCENVLLAIRQIIRAIDLHSKYLAKKFGLTGTQLLILKEIISIEESHVGEIAKRINLSQATVTSVLDRLERLKYIKRTRSDSDKRKVIVNITKLGRNKLEKNPSLLQQYFIDRFRELKEWEQTLILSALQRVASMMKAEKLEVLPVLTSEPVSVTTGDIKEITEVEDENKEDTINKMGFK